jgi:hypothetical protein
MSTYEHVCGACGRPDTPRVWRDGDREPGDDVRCVMDQDGDVWQRGSDGCWVMRDCRVWFWIDLMLDGPLVEVTLPEPVLS